MPYDRPIAIIPARNEGPTIVDVIDELHRSVPALDILVIDDGSRDDTSCRARSAGALVVRHAFSLGYGGALETGYLYAMRHEYEVVLQLDADGQHDPATAPALLECVRARRTDVVLASRFLAGGRPARGLLRSSGTRALRALGRALAGLDTSDPTSGYRALNARAVRTLLSEPFPDDYPDIDVLIHLRARGITIVEVPTSARSRSAGTSMHAGLGPLYYAYKVALASVIAAARGRFSPTRAA